MQTHYRARAPPIPQNTRAIRMNIFTSDYIGYEYHALQ